MSFSYAKRADPRRKKSAKDSNSHLVRDFPHSRRSPISPHILQIYAADDRVNFHWASSINGNLDSLDEDLLHDNFGERDDSSVYSSEEETLGATTTDQPDNEMQTKDVEVIWKCLVSLRSFASSIYLISICRT